MNSSPYIQTERRGDELTARLDGETATLPWDENLSELENHKAAAALLGKVNGFLQGKGKFRFPLVFHKTSVLGVAYGIRVGRHNSKLLRAFFPHKPNVFLLVEREEDLFGAALAAAEQFAHGYGLTLSGDYLDLNKSFFFITERVYQDQKVEWM